MEWKAWGLIEELDADDGGCGNIYGEIELAGFRRNFPVAQGQSLIKCHHLHINIVTCQVQETIHPSQKGSQTQIILTVIQGFKHQSQSQIINGKHVN